MPDAAVAIEGRANQLQVRVNGPNPTFVIRSDVIRRKAMAELDPNLLDLLDIAAVVFAADGTISRGHPTRPGMGVDWRRRLDFTIPVRNPELWSTTAVVDALTEAVGFMTEDSVTFRFTRQEHGPIQEPFLAFEPGGAAFEADDVILFSGGLDSFAGALEVLSTTTSRVILITHRSSQKAIPHQTKLGGFLSERFEGRVLHIHVPAHRVGEAAIESTQRSRALLFAALGQAVAQAFNARKVSFFENGIISHNLPLSRQIVGSMASRTTHPLTLSALNRLIAQVIPNPVRCENIYQWLTKTEVVSRVANYDGVDKLAITASCTNNRGRDSVRTHCGACSQCLDRRFAILANGLARYDPGEIYETDVLFGARDVTPSRTMAMEWTRHALRFGEMNEGELVRRFGLEVSRIARAHAGQPANLVNQLTFDMHRRHGLVVRRVLESAVRDKAAELVDHAFPATSLVVMHVHQTVPAEDAVPRFQTPARALTEVLLDTGQTDTMPDPESRLQVAFFEENGHAVVAVAGIGRVMGTPALVPHGLKPVFEEDLRAGQMADGHRYTAPAMIPGLSMSKPQVRQNVSRCRKSLASDFEQIHGRPPDHHLLIQSRSPAGYRLDPLIEIVPNHEA